MSCSLGSSSPSLSVLPISPSPTNLASPTSVLGLSEDVLQSVLDAAYGSSVRRLLFFATCKTAQKLDSLWGESLEVMTEPMAPKRFMAMLGRAPTLRTLRWANRCDLSRLRLPHRLETLRITNAALDGALSSVAPPSLRTLVLHDCFVLQADGFLSQSKPTQLLHLGLDFVFDLSLSGLRRACPNLCSLTLGVVPSADIRHLLSLHISRLSLSGDDISDLSLLSRLPLTSLSLDLCCAIRDWRPLGKMERLRFLDLSSTKVKNKDLVCLTQLPLEVLALCNTRASDAGLQHLPRIRSRLFVGGSRVSPDGARAWVAGLQAPTPSMEPSMDPSTDLTTAPVPTTVWVDILNDP
jgi:hypothetical protein